MPEMKESNMAYLDIIDSISENPVNPNIKMLFNLDNSLRNIAHRLPAQGPIKDFIHHNTLHAVQHYPFHEGIAIAARFLVRAVICPWKTIKKCFNKVESSKVILIGLFAILEVIN